MAHFKFLPASLQSSHVSTVNAISVRTLKQTYSAAVSILIGRGDFRWGGARGSHKSRRDH